MSKHADVGPTSKHSFTHETIIKVVASALELCTI
jgi:hypothetical protein